MGSSTGGGLTGFNMGGSQPMTDQMMQSITGSLQNTPFSGLLNKKLSKMGGAQTPEGMGTSQSQVPQAMGAFNSPMPDAARQNLLQTMIQRSRGGGQSLTDNAMPAPSGMVIK